MSRDLRWLNSRGVDTNRSGISSHYNGFVRVELERTRKKRRRQVYEQADNKEQHAQLSRGSKGESHLLLTMGMILAVDDARQMRGPREGLHLCQTPLAA